MIVAPLFLALLACLAQDKPDEDRPRLYAVDVFAGQGDQLKAVTDSQIKILQKLLEVTAKTDPEYPDYLFRMAELYAEQERYYSFRERGYAEQRADAGPGEPADKLQKQELDARKRGVMWRSEAIKKYKNITDNPQYKGYAKLDQVLFYMSYLLSQAGEAAASDGYFQRLLNEFPKSSYVPHAYLTQGEAFFEKRDFDKALALYEKCCESPDSPVFGYSRYKQGWVYYYRKDYKKALEIFSELARSAKRGEAQLAKEASKDVLRTLSLMPEVKPEEVVRVAASLAPARAAYLSQVANLLQGVSDLFKKQGRTEAQALVDAEIQKLRAELGEKK